MGSESALPMSTESISQTTDANALPGLRPRPAALRSPTPPALRPRAAGDNGKRRRGSALTARWALPLPGGRDPAALPTGSGRPQCPRPAGTSRVRIPARNATAAPGPRFDGRTRSSSRAAAGPDPRALPEERLSAPSAAEAPPGLCSARLCLARTPARVAALCLRAASPALGEGLSLPRITPAARVPGRTKGRRHRRRRRAQPHRDTRDVLLALVGHGAALPAAVRCPPLGSAQRQRRAAPTVPAATGDGSPARPAPPRAARSAARGRPRTGTAHRAPTGLAAHRPSGAALPHRAPHARRGSAGTGQRAGLSPAPLLGKSRGSGR